jgi:hypothetical protein
MLLHAKMQIPVNPFGIIVDKNSATPYSNGTMKFNKNHIDLVKPSDRSDPAYSWVKQGILGCLQNSRECPSAHDTLPECGRLPEGLADPSFEVTTRLGNGANSH